MNLTGRVFIDEGTIVFLFLSGIIVVFVFSDVVAPSVSLDVVNSGENGYSTTGRGGGGGACLDYLSVYGDSISTVI